MLGLLLCSFTVRNLQGQWGSLVTAASNGAVKFLLWRLRPEVVQPLPFNIPFLTERYPFRAFY